MGWIIDHLHVHLLFAAFSWLVYLVWPWIRRRSWPATPDFDVPHGWALLTAALIAAVMWVLWVWLAFRHGWL